MHYRRLAARFGFAGFFLLVLVAGAPQSPTLAESCAPRPSVGVIVTPTSPQNAELTVTLTAGTSAGITSNQLESVRFNAIHHARIDAGSRTGETRTFAVDLPAGTKQFSFLVHPEQAGVTPTVHLVVHDACGAWPTFVGGTYTPPSVSCSPRPRVVVATLPLGPDALQATVRVTGSHNQLQVLEVGAASNALLDIDGRTGVPGNNAITLPAGTEQFSFTLHRSGPGAYSVGLTAVDGCGRWPTFVGAGGSILPPGGEEPVSCVPRPPVQLTTVADAGRLESTLRASGAANRLLAVEFGAAINSLVEVADHDRAPGNFNISVPVSTSAVSFTLHPIAPDVYSLPLVVVDRCGRWPTLVGAGAPPPPDGGGEITPVDSVATPELDSIVLFAAGALALAGLAWRQRQKLAT
jgi:hypothetical protein